MISYPCPRGPRHFIMWSRCIWWPARARGICQNRISYIIPTYVRRGIPGQNDYLNYRSVAKSRKRQVRRWTKRVNSEFIFAWDVWFPPGVIMVPCFRIFVVSEYILETTSARRNRCNLLFVRLKVHNSSSSCFRLSWYIVIFFILFQPG